MTHLTRTSVRLPTALRKRIDDLAAATDRSTSTVIQAALESYLDVNDWQVAAIKASLSDPRLHVPHSEVIARVSVKLAKALG